jgi:5-(carboxyamino)imidazole ribonucleotide mutase
MPSGVAPMVVLDPENAALAAAKILGLVSERIAQSVAQQQENQRKRLLTSDKEP